MPKSYSISKDIIQNSGGIQAFSLKCWCLWLKIYIFIIILCMAVIKCNVSYHVYYVPGYTKQPKDLIKRLHKKTCLDSN